MGKKETAADRFKRFTLWQWGLLLISAGVFAGAIMSGGNPAAGRLTMEQQAQWLGQSIAVTIFIVFGSGLIAVHFLRRRKRTEN